MRAAVDAAQAKRAAKQGITQDKVVAELAKIGFANMQDYMKVGADGDPHFDFSSLTRDQAAALAEVTVDTVGKAKVGEHEMAPVKRVKFRLHDKRAALVDLGKHLGMFKETALPTVRSVTFIIER